MSISKCLYGCFHIASGENGIWKKNSLFFFLIKIIINIFYQFFSLNKKNYKTLKILYLFFYFIYVMFTDSKKKFRYP